MAIPGSLLAVVLAAVTVTFLGSFEGPPPPSERPLPGPLQPVGGEERSAAPGPAEPADGEEQVAPGPVLVPEAPNSQVPIPPRPRGFVEPTRLECSYGLGPDGRTRCELGMTVRNRTNGEVWDILMSYEMKLEGGLGNDYHGEAFSDPGVRLRRREATVVRAEVEGLSAGFYRVKACVERFVWRPPDRVSYAATGDDLECLEAVIYVGPR